MINGLDFVTANKTFVQEYLRWMEVPEKQMSYDIVENPPKRKINNISLIILRVPKVGLLSLIYHIGLSSIQRMIMLFIV